MPLGLGRGATFPWGLLLAGPLANHRRKCWWCPSRRSVSTVLSLGLGWWFPAAPRPSYMGQPLPTRRPSRRLRGSACSVGPHGFRALPVVLSLPYLGEHGACWGAGIGGRVGHVYTVALPNPRGQDGTGTLPTAHPPCRWPSPAKHTLSSLLSTCPDPPPPPLQGGQVLRRASAHTTLPQL